MKIKLLIMVTMAILTIALAIYGNAFWIFTGLTTAALFDNLTSNAYGSEVIKQLKTTYDEN